MNSYGKTNDGIKQISICQNDFANLESYKEFCVKLDYSVGGSLGLQQIRF